MWSLHRTLTLLCCGLFPVSIAGGAQTSPGAAEGPSLFGSNLVHRFRIEIAAADLQKLRQDPRQDVRVSVRHGDKFYPDTALHLKGRVGSFRDVDDKPGMTLSFDKFGAREPLGEVLKVHLNNSVEDPTYLNEALGAELFGGAGVPAARVAHALVELNGRDLGLYVLKEAFTKEFLSRYFRRTDGNLYEPVPSTGEEPQIRRTCWI